MSGLEREGKEVTLIKYRITSPDVYRPPADHKRLGENSYIGPYEPHYEQLDELGIITVEDWDYTGDS